ncbi:DUF6114 domain-containing protein [Micromonospora rubida]|uniref:DUF6114 domain-containing protein n=1 Tax=Micromonospora rubida TaxID=2697657 RepID=UPI0013772DC3|nr:DUF6114 domain-containing protein [Micromonospora rubida]NBE85258.1 hypothetical protein [Micromonospora rubida]
MTTANPQHAQSGRLSQAWRGFRRWRWSRPFWGGLFTALAGVEIFATTQMSLSDLTFQMGPTGFLSWLIPVILVASGMLMWFTPQQRMFYAIVGAVTAVFSLIGVNLGGFFVGLLFGMVGGALGFAWVPSRRPATATAPAEPEPAARPDHDGPRVLGPDGRQQGGPHRDPELLAVRAGGQQGGPHQDSKLLAITLVLLSVSAVGALALRDQSPVQGAPATLCPTPSRTSASPTAARPSASGPAGESPSPTPSPSPGKTSDGNLTTNIIYGIGDLLAGDDALPAAGAGATEGPGATEGATPATTATPTRGPDPSAKPTPDASAGTGKPGPDGPGCATPKPTEPGEVEAGKPLPRIAAEPGQPRVAAEPSKLTGSKVTMTGLRFEGIVELDTGAGKLRALKFSMDKAVTDDFLLQAGGPGGKTMRYAADRLTVQGDVAFYATRFVGRLLGIKITLAPDLPFPDGIPVTSPIPITFTDPVIDLAYVDSDILTAKPELKLTLA